jgi:hypothetical protein
MILCVMCVTVMSPMNNPAFDAGAEYDSVKNSDEFVEFDE